MYFMDCAPLQLVLIIKLFSPLSHPCVSQPAELPQHVSVRNKTRAGTSAGA